MAGADRRGIFTAGYYIECALWAFYRKRTAIWNENAGIAAAAAANVVVGADKTYCRIAIAGDSGHVRLQAWPDCHVLQGYGSSLGDGNFIVSCNLAIKKDFTLERLVAGESAENARNRGNAVIAADVVVLGVLLREGTLRDPPFTVRQRIKECMVVGERVVAIHRDCGDLANRIVEFYEGVVAAGAVGADARIAFRAGRRDIAALEEDVAALRVASAADAGAGAGHPHVDDEIAVDDFLAAAIRHAAARSDGAAIDDDVAAVEVFAAADAGGIALAVDVELAEAFDRERVAGGDEDAGEPVAARADLVLALEDDRRVALAGEAGAGLVGFLYFDVGYRHGRAVGDRHPNVRVVQRAFDHRAVLDDRVLRQVPQIDRG